MWLVREQERNEEIRRRNEEVGNLEREQEEFSKISFWTQVTHSTIFRGFLIIILISIIVPILLMIFLNVSDAEFDENHTCSIFPEYQIACGPQNTTYDKCTNLKCCYNETERSCYHKIPSYYVYDSVEKGDNYLHLDPAMVKTPFGNDSKQLYLYWITENINKLSLILTEQKQEQLKNKRLVTNGEYMANIYEEQMSIEVNRTNSSDILLSTALGPTIISENYWEWTVDLKAEQLYGMDFFRLMDNETVQRLVYKNAESHNSVPKFLAYKNGKYHGLGIEHEGPLEVTVLRSKLIVLRMLSGSYLKVDLFTGPTPSDVYRQQMVGGTEVKFPPYWALGVHICRDGLISNVDDVIKEHEKFLGDSSDLPYDSDCIHENLFSLSMDLTQDIKNAINSIHNAKKHFFMSLAPQIFEGSLAYNDAVKLNILYEVENATYQGLYLNETVAYPDYSMDEAKNWFVTAFTRAFSGLNFVKDGLLLRNNWPHNELHTLDDNSDFMFQFPYMTNDIQKAINFTLPWYSASPGNSRQHISTHNQYGAAHARLVAAQQNPDFFLSATFNSQTPYHTHSQNVNVSWTDYKNMLRNLLSHSLFGGTLFSSPICGSSEYFDLKIHQAACLRWYLTAATLPLFRVTSVAPRRDPTSFDHLKHMKNIGLNSIRMRYMLLPYFYTVLARNKAENLPLTFVQPMFFNYPDDNNTLILDEQYMIGDSLLVAQPNLFPIEHMRIYLPENEGMWYEFWGGQRIPNKGWIRLPIVESDLPIFIASGRIVPLQNEIALTAEESRTKPLKLAIALACTGINLQCNATGFLQPGDENSMNVEFYATDKSLQISNAKLCDSTTPTNAQFSISRLQIYGFDLPELNICHIQINNPVNLCVQANSRYDGITYSPAECEKL